MFSDALEDIEFLIKRTREEFCNNDTTAALLYLNDIKTMADVGIKRLIEHEKRVKA